MFDKSRKERRSTSLWWLDYLERVDKIKFNIKQVNSDNLINSIHIMSEADYMFNEIRSNYINYIVGTIIIILGLILMVSVMCIPNKTLYL